MPLSRRVFLYCSAFAPTAYLLQGCSTDTVAGCVDPEMLTRGEAHMRKTLEYTAASTNDAQTCANCQFFQGDAGSACGNCEILSGPAASAGYCTSWALKS